MLTNKHKMNRHMTLIQLLSGSRCFLSFQVPDSPRTSLLSDAPCYTASGKPSFSSQWLQSGNRKTAHWLPLPQLSVWSAWVSWFLSSLFQSGLYCLLDACRVKCLLCFPTVHRAGTVAPMDKEMPNMAQLPGIRPLNLRRGLRRMRPTLI